MAKKPRSNKKSESDIREPSFRARWAKTVISLSLCFLLGSLSLIALWDYAPDQSALHATNPSDRNAIGIFGVVTAQYLLMGLGGFAWVAPILLLWMSWLIIKKDRRSKWIVSGAMILLLASGAGLLSIQDSVAMDRAMYHNGPGGSVGYLIYDELMETYVGNVGSALILGVMFAVALAVVVIRTEENFLETLKQRWTLWREESAARREERREAKRLAKLAAQEARERRQAEKEEAKALLREQKAAGKEKEPATKKKPNLEPEIDPEPKVKISIPRKKEQPEVKEEEPEKKPPLGTALKFVAAEETKKARIKLPKSIGDYTFPNLDLLVVPAKPHHTNSEEEHSRNAERLVNTLKEFGVEVSMGEIHIGPVITRYEVYPAPGVRVEKISNLDKNIALGMRAQSVRILAPVPGKGCVGIEVPNQNPTPVGIREILESEDWVKSKAEIPIALGRDVSGKPIISDLTRMPHLLIAGATGAGKTVCINAIITSLLYHASPETLRFIMVDPKIVEMKVFNSLPHMLIPVVTDPKKVPGALKWLLNEMEHRYEMFAKVGVRNIAGFNGRKKPEKEKTEAEKVEDDQAELEISVPRDAGVLGEMPEKLPYIVCIVDELADLMMVAPADIETGIARIAQLARAAGIHLILATQRPSVNVITGVIKANLPCRISFQVASKIDSRTILDGPGAEQLIGRGDMLFSPPGSSNIIRSQGAFVSDEEIQEIVEFLKTNGPPSFAEDVQRQIDEPDELSLGGVENGESDELMPQAIEVLRATKRASTSMLQRRLRIGYNRAARLMEILEDRGIVGPENGSSPREILVDLDSM